ncbi:elongation factor EF-2 [Candidatus Bathyarchaeota archaeon]|nr:elongation factor EF-2 [Candidatus Bathyarchaeota archaeon]
MPRFRHTADILQFMGKKESIRNLGILAHIDHGKTTLTDSLLAGTGLLAPQVAGSARVLDYLEEEQRRGITLKTANISLLYRTVDGAFIINLVDTPGHVDFTGKVTRALRTIDGAVVLVDAVEEVMAQTELVVRQALEERVQPVLFINKVDRLITELQLNAEQIEKKFTHIISNFNDLIEIHGEPTFKDKWKVESTGDSVAFGSALHKWGFTLTTARQKNVKFSDIIHAYKTAGHEKLQKLLPLCNAILDMAIKHVPNPRKAQKYRVERIWKGNMTSEVGQAMVNCDDTGPAVMCVTNVQAAPNKELVATGRVFSGTVKTGAKVYLVNAQTESTIQQVSVFMGAFKEPVSKVSAGNLVALAGLEHAKVGETVVSAEHKDGVVPFEQIRYVSEPVVTVAVEPKNPADLPELLEAVDQLAKEDPNLAASVNKETGEHLLSGMGELHLEIAVKQLGKNLGNMEISASSPRVVYREKATRRGIIATALSPNQQNKFTVQVETLTKKTVNLMEQESKSRSVEGVLVVEEHENVLVDCTGKNEQLQEALDFVISGFKFACNAGPLCGEPMRGTQVNLLDIQLSEDAEQCSPMEIMRGVGKAVFGSFLTAEPVLLEPVYTTVISTPTELVGACSRIVNSRRGKISAFEQKVAFTVLTSHIPVAGTFGLSAELRSATSGRAFWQSMFDHWEKMPTKLGAKTIKEIRERKGLPVEAPRAERFLEEKP